MNSNDSGTPPVSSSARPFGDARMPPEQIKQIQQQEQLLRTRREEILNDIMMQQNELEMIPVAPTHLRRKIVCTAASILGVTSDIDDVVYKLPLLNREIAVQQLSQCAKIILLLDTLNCNKFDENESASYIMAMQIESDRLDHLNQLFRDFLADASGDIKPSPSPPRKGSPNTALKKDKLIRPAVSFDSDSDDGSHDDPFTEFQHLIRKYVLARDRLENALRKAETSGDDGLRNKFISMLERASAFDALAKSKAYTESTAVMKLQDALACKSTVRSKRDAHRWILGVQDTINGTNNSRLFDSTQKLGDLSKRIRKQLFRTDAILGSKSGDNAYKVCLWDSKKAWYEKKFGKSMDDSDTDEICHNLIEWANSLFDNFDTDDETGIQAATDTSTGEATGEAEGQQQIGKQIYSASYALTTFNTIHFILFYQQRFCAKIYDFAKNQLCSRLKRLNAKQKITGNYQGAIPLTSQDWLHIQNYILKGHTAHAGMPLQDLQTLVAMLFAANTGLRPQSVLSVPLASFEWVHVHNDETQVREARYMRYVSVCNKGLTPEGLEFATMEVKETLLESDFVLPFLLLMEARGFINSAVDVFNETEELNLKDPALNCETVGASEKAFNEANRFCRRIAMTKILRAKKKFVEDYDPDLLATDEMMKEFEASNIKTLPSYFQHRIKQNRQSHGMNCLFVDHRSGLPTSVPMTLRHLQECIRTVTSHAGYLTDKFAYISLYSGRRTLISEVLTCLNVRNMNPQNMNLIQDAQFMNSGGTREHEYLHKASIRANYPGNMFSPRTDDKTVNAIAGKGALRPALLRTTGKHPTFRADVEPLSTKLAATKVEYLTKYGLPNHRHYGRCHPDGVGCPFYGCKEKFTWMADVINHVRLCKTRETSVNGHHPGTIYCTECDPPGWIPAYQTYCFERHAVQHTQYGCNPRLGLYSHKLPVPLHQSYKCEVCHRFFCNINSFRKHKSTTKECRRIQPRTRNPFHKTLSAPLTTSIVPHKMNVRAPSVRLHRPAPHRHRPNQDRPPGMVPPLAPRPAPNGPQEEGLEWVPEIQEYRPVIVEDGSNDRPLPNRARTSTNLRRLQEMERLSSVPPPPSRTPVPPTVTTTPARKPPGSGVPPTPPPQPPTSRKRSVHITASRTGTNKKRFRPLPPKK